LGIGDWGLGPIPNPQSPIPNNIEINYYIILKSILKSKEINKKLIFNSYYNNKY